MNFFHKNDIYYGDMKPKNILIFRDFTVKVGDLGCSI